MRRPPHNTSQSTASERRATVVLEFLLAIPIALGLVFAIAEFGILLASVKYVEMAALEGAREVSHLERSHLHRAAKVARNQADRVLHTAGLGRSCAVFVRHNVHGGSHSGSRHGSCPCGPSRNPLPHDAPIAAIQCTVTVPMGHLTPNLLSYLGFSTENRYISASHTVPYLREH